MKYKFSPGQPTKFTPENVEKLIDAIGEVIVLKHAAQLAGLSVVSVYNWMNQGIADIKEDKWTEHAQFFYALNNARSNEATGCLKKIKGQTTNWQASAWILERCFREDFGQDAGIIQDLLAKCEKLEQDFKRINDNALQGVT